MDKGPSVVVPAKIMGSACGLADARTEAYWKPTDDLSFTTATSTVPPDEREYVGQVSCLCLRETERR